MTAAQIRDAARLVGADATAENCLHRTGEVAEVWVAGFIAALEEISGQTSAPWFLPPLQVVDELLGEARLAAELVDVP